MVETGWTAAGCCNFTVDGNADLGNSGAKNTYCLTGTTDTGSADAADMAQTIDNHGIIIFMRIKKKKSIFVVILNILYYFIIFKALERLFN